MAVPGLAFDDKLYKMWKTTIEKFHGELDPTDADELKRYCGIMAQIHQAYRNVQGKEVSLGKVNPLISYIEKMERIADMMSRKLGLHTLYRFTAMKARKMAQATGEDDDITEDDLTGEVALP